MFFRCQTCSVRFSPNTGSMGGIAMQNTLDGTAAARSLTMLEAAAIRAGVPAATADEARRATAARFRVPGIEAALSGRVESYFWGVIRRRALTGGAPALRASMLALSLATELAAAGHGADAVRREVARCYGESLLQCVEPVIARASAA
jgi:hypothetical protein